MNRALYGNAENRTGTGTKEKGDKGEAIAAEHLLANGYHIICRKYQSRKGEIDCVARDPDGTLVFIEVKSSMNGACGSPFTWVTPLKQRKLMAMARQYLAEHRITSTPCRFDVIGITRGKVEHIRNAIIGM